MKKINLLLFALMGVLVSFAQRIDTMTFIGQTIDGSYCRFDSVVIENLTKGWTETLIYPDTFLVLIEDTMSAVPAYQDEIIFRMSPNPFNGSTRVTVQSPVIGEAVLQLTEIGGRICSVWNGELSEGGNVFAITVQKPQTYILTVRTASGTKSLKLSNMGSGGFNRIEPIGNTSEFFPVVKSRGLSTQPFNSGDVMRYQGFASLWVSKEIRKSQNDGEVITLVFDTTAKPCPMMPTVCDFDGNAYNTILLGGQCWMKENLRSEHYSDGTEIAAGAGSSLSTAFRYIPNDDESNIPEYGYLYNWFAAIGYGASSVANPSGVQGICPSGWHLPSDAEWAQLLNYVQNNADYVCGLSSDYIAKALASSDDWFYGVHYCAVGNDPATNNASGFNAQPAGVFNGVSEYFGYYSIFWTATERNNGALSRSLYCAHPNVGRTVVNKSHGHSVRCVYDSAYVFHDTSLTVTTNDVSDITATSAICGGLVSTDYSAAVMERGVCWGEGQNPDLTGDHTHDGSGEGSFTSIITGLQPETTYFVRAYAISGVDTVYGEGFVFTTVSMPIVPSACGNTTTVSDYDGNVYQTVSIGQQCWMKANLRTTHFANGTPISLGTVTSLDSAYRYYPNEAASTVNTYGYLYNWKAVMNGSVSSQSNPSGVQGICPTGWHVPSNLEWFQLENYMENQEDYLCGETTGFVAKSLASTNGWVTSEATCSVGNNQSENNTSGFSAQPAGYCYGYFDTFGKYACYWSSTEVSESGYAWSRSLRYNLAVLQQDNGGSSKVSGLSVRCLRDE